MAKVAVVIPNWNGEDMVAECLQSLEKQTLAADIIVVDNGSVDDSVGIIEKRFPKVRLVKLPENTGFAGGVNTGFRQAMEDGYEMVAVFNNDAVADENWLKNLVSAMKKYPKTGIVSCKQLRTGGEYIDSTGDEYTIWGFPFPRGRNQKDEDQFDKAEEIFSAPAGATLYRTKMLESVGLFDEKFFAYFEDVDISFRARLAGWQVRYEPKAVVYHAVSATGSKLGSFSRYHTVKNFFMLYTKNMPGWLYWKYLPLFLMQAIRLGLSSLYRRQLGAYLLGVMQAVINLPAVLVDRRKIQATRKISASAIDSWLVKQAPARAPKIEQ